MRRMTPLQQPRVLELEIESDTAQLSPLREKLRAFLKETGLEPKVQESILVALGEACTNSIRHSYSNKPGHKVRVKAEDLPEKVVFKVRDFGDKIDLTKLETPPTLPPVKPGGLGIYFMRTIMDEVEYNTALSEGNELILVKLKKGESRR